MDLLTCEAALVTSEKFIESASTLVSHGISAMQAHLHLGPHKIMWTNAYVARMRGNNSRYRRKLRIELVEARTGLLDRYKTGTADIDLGGNLLHAVQQALAACIAVRTSWQLFSHQYDNCLLFLTGGERADMEAAFEDIALGKSHMEGEVTQVTSELRDWMPAFSIILPEAAFQRCLSTLSRAGWSRREAKRLVRPLVDDLARMSMENTSLLHEDATSFREILSHLRNLHSGIGTIAECYNSSQAFLQRRGTVLSSLEHQMRIVVAIQDLLQAAYLCPLAIPNVDGTLVPVDSLREAFGRYRGIRTTCERILEACSSLEKKLGVNRDLLTALSPIEYRIGAEDNQC